MNKPPFAYKWYLKDGYPAPNIEKHGLKVYTTFSCGGGSSMGYKLAGYNVIGANDIDPQMTKVYQENHKPKFYDLCPIGDLLTKDLPEEYYDLDILDGSPPCSTFSISGQREKAFKKDKVFREGQAKQVLSDLFFDWIKLVDKLNPKVAIAENVKGMLFGNAKAYTSTVLKKIDKIGYDVQLFCLNGASMGLPQKRERIFFICKRKDLNLPKLTLEFNEKPILFKEIEDKDDIEEIKNRETRTYKGWLAAKPDQSFRDGLGDGGSMFGYVKISLNSIVRTLVSSNGTSEFHPTIFRKLNTIEISQAGSFPLDYNYLDVSPEYLIGMSVPPVMTAQIAYQIYLQLFKQ